MANQQIPKPVRAVANRVPMVRRFGGTDAIEQVAEDSVRAHRELGGTGPMLIELAKDVPALFKMLWRVARDGRVQLRYRIALAGLLGYAASPIDLVPEWLPVIGAVDDLVLAVLGVRWVLRAVDRTILDEHWDGAPVVLDLLTGRSRA